MGAGFFADRAHDAFLVEAQLGQELALFAMIDKTVRQAEA